MAKFHLSLNAFTFQVLRRSRLVWRNGSLGDFLLCILLLFVAATPTLTAAAEAPSLTICSGDFPPYNSPLLPNLGPVVEITTEAFRRSGISIQVIFMPWARILKEGQNAKCAILGIWRNAQRDQQFVYTQAILEQELGYFARRSSNFKNSKPLQLETLVIGVERGSYLSPELEGKQYSFDIANSLLLNLRKLAKGRIDLAYGNKAAGEYLINTDPELNDPLVWLNPSLESKPIYLAFSNSYPEKEHLILAYNQGLTSMKADGSFKKILLKAKLSP
ncbi:substrate-binding periplasmic protein [Undibacterium parvum]|uniref:Transporter substrate-binding domain-containing protein n=1 Tax=Undibacterium parvum TaxID=401471 RepID=A0A3Q9BU64_9BURK|nr:transporter substrate-binding domain-containing protein [Undibacterium parvum]AZP14134.1 transporter substrate-binding domain-containing protein [Undibacterium parvum]